MTRSVLIFKITLLIICVILLNKSYSANVRKIDNIGSYGSIHIFKSNPDIVYVFGNGIYRIIDGGDKWKKISGRYFYRGGLNSDDPAILYGFADQTDMTQSFYFSTDSGKTWTFSCNDGQVGQRYIIISSTNFPYPVYADLIPLNQPDCGLAVSYDTCKTWQGIKTPAAGITSLDFFEGNDSLIYLGTYKRGVYRSRDKGESCDSLGLYGLNGNNYIAANPENPNIIYSAIENHGIYKTTDGGQSWQEKNNGLLSDKVANFILNHNNPDHLFLGTYYNGLFFSRDAGENWEQLQPLPADSWIVGLAFDERSEKLFFSITCRSDDSKSGLYVAESIFTSINERRVGKLREFKLNQNYPNPFNAETWIQYIVPSPGNIRLDIYDISGRRIQTILDGRQSPGTHRIKWDGRDDQGKAVSSGVYVYQLRAGGKSLTSKLLLVR